MLLVHDYLLVMRGAERTFAAMADCWPDADLATLLYDQEGTGGRFADRNVRTSGLQRLGIRQDGFRKLLPLLPHAASNLDVSGADFVLSSSSAFAHGIRVPEGVTHVCYCHSPFRYAWHERDRAFEEFPGAARPMVKSVFGAVRRWDRKAAERTTHYIANSELTRSRIQEFWGRDAQVIHPPVQVERFTPDLRGGGEYFLTVGELTRHKRVELALQACKKAGVKVKVIGTGPDAERLAHEYAGTAEFLGRIPDAELTAVYEGARAFILPNVEDFGIAAVEAQAAGRPVIAAGAGGALETVRNGLTGVHFPVEDVDALAEILRHVDFDRFDPARIARHASAFSTVRFMKELRAFVADTASAPPLPAVLDVPDVRVARQQRKKLRPVA